MELCQMLKDALIEKRKKGKKEEFIMFHIIKLLFFFIFDQKQTSSLI